MRSVMVWPCVFRFSKVYYCNKSSKRVRDESMRVLEAGTVKEFFAEFEKEWKKSLEENKQ